MSGGAFENLGRSGGDNIAGCQPPSVSARSLQPVGRNKIRHSLGCARKCSALVPVMTKIAIVGATGPTGIHLS
jgi:hypothetical protein